MIVLVPPKLQIAGFGYDVHFVKRDKELEAEGAYGQCSNMLRRLKVESKLSEQERSKIFLHEILEALNCVYLDNQLAHEQIQRLSYGLHQITEQLQLHFTQELGADNEVETAKSLGIPVIFPFDGDNSTLNKPKEMEVSNGKTTQKASTMDTY